MIFAASFFYTLSDEDIDNWEPSEAARFVMFEYLCMSQIHGMLKIVTPYFSPSEDFLTCLVDKIKSEIPEDFGEKQRICYAIVQTLVAVHKRKMPSDSFRKLFDKAWKMNKNIGRGRLDKDYIQKIRALYYTINK